MLKTILMLPDGSILSSGGGTDCAVRHFSWTQCVNEEQELTLGSVCAAMVEIELLTPQGGLSLKEGDAIRVVRQDETGVSHPVGVFLTEKPVRSSANTMKLTAYDNVSKLDKNLTGWLEGLTQWPYTLQELAEMVSEACGVVLRKTELPNGNYPVEKFTASGITGRQMMRWIGQLCGRFCRATPEGELEFAWYTESGLTVTPSGTHYYYQGKLSYSDDGVSPVEKVQLRQTQEDVGTVYPNISGEVNTYCITANPLLSASSGDSLIGVAQTLYEQLQGVTYRPCKLTVPAGFSIAAGDIITVTDRNGIPVRVYVMTRTQSGNTDTLECTGNARRDSTTAVNEMSYKTLSGKVLELKTTVDGLKAENRDASGKMASLTLDVEGIATEVSRQQSQLDSVNSRLTGVTQTAEDVQIKVRSMMEEGTKKVTTETGFTFDSQGLTIRKSGTQMENLLNETGMFVKRSGEVILQADHEGVTAVDVTVRNYLMVGEHARFEDYSSGGDSKRTACYWM